MVNPKIGEIHETNRNGKITIIDCKGDSNCTIQFEDGTIKENVFYCRILDKRIGRNDNRVGEKHINNEGYILEIIKYESTHKVTVKLEDGNIISGLTYTKIKSGAVRNPFARNICEVGYLGIPDEKVDGVLFNKSYRNWKGIIERCYDKKGLTKYLTYTDCTVAEDWQNSQNFYKWFKVNYHTKYMDRNWHIDKDILQKGNKIW